MVKGDVQETVKSDLLSVIRRGLGFLQKGQYADLKELSNHTIHNSSIFQDEDSLSMAVVMYSLSKIAERGHKPDQAFLGLLRDSEHDLEGGDFRGYRQRIKAIFRKVAQIDHRLRLYIEEVIRMGRVRKGSKIYDHGISLAQTAELLGISQWELASYAGRTETKEHSTPQQTEARIVLARKLFSQ